MDFWRANDRTLTSTLLPKATSNRHSVPSLSSWIVGAMTVSTGADNCRPGKDMLRACPSCQEDKIYLGSYPSSAEGNRRSRTLFGNRGNHYATVCDFG